MLRVLPFVVFFALRAVAHATVPDPFDIRTARHDAELHRALVQVLDVAATSVEPARRFARLAAP
ncbi:MAG TPA: hypothetical protein VGX21_21090 [Methylomirabilota bacterium]|jgi:hypothetical protein|nr:hypothetical protein [Methylomirabilota bacterium]